MTTIKDPAALKELLIRIIKTMEGGWSIGSSRGIYPLILQVFGKESVNKYMKLQQLIDNLKFNHVSTDIKENNFPQRPAETKVDLYRIQKFTISEQILKDMDAKGLRPANIYELLAWAKDNWNGEDWTAALGSVWSGYVPCVVGYGGYRDLGLLAVASVWSSDYAFAVVRKSSDTGTVESSDTWENNYCQNCGKKLNHQCI